MRVKIIWREELVRTHKPSGLVESVKSFYEFSRKLFLKPEIVLIHQFVLVSPLANLKMKLMRVLIQSTVTFLYLMDRNTATQDAEEARDFKHASKALRFIKENRLPNVQIVLKFPKTSDDVNLAILELLDREQQKSAMKIQTAHV